MSKRRKRDRKPPTAKFGVAWYKPEQWARLLEISQDRQDLEDTYAEWEAHAEDGLHRLAGQGLAPEKVIVDVEELLAWCNEKGIPVNGSSRSEYTAWSIRERDKNR
jgi:hypothetical protein